MWHCARLRATGARQIVTGLNELERRHGKVSDHTEVCQLRAVLISWSKGSRYFDVHGHRDGCCSSIFGGVLSDKLIIIIRNIT